MLFQGFKTEDYRLKQVVEFVRYSARQLTKRFQSQCFCRPGFE